MKKFRFDGSLVFTVALTVMLMMAVVEGCGAAWLPRTVMTFLARAWSTTSPGRASMPCSCR